MTIEELKLKLANKEAIPFIEEMGWKSVEDGLWLSPYENPHSFAGARVQPTLAKYLIELDTRGIRRRIQKAANKFPEQESPASDGKN